MEECKWESGNREMGKRKEDEKGDGGREGKGRVGKEISPILISESRRLCVILSSE